MLFCEVSKVVGWKSQVVYSLTRFGLILLYLLFVDRSCNYPHYPDMLSMEC